MAVLLTVLAIIFTSSFFLTLLIKKYAIKRCIIDLPNERSSHIAPTPRGGGVAFAIVILISLLIFKYSYVVLSAFKLIDIICLAMITLLGFYDDKKSLSPVIRLVAQMGASLVFLITLIPTPALATNIFTINPGVLLDVVIVLYLVWLINLYNFMDGINGIASLEAIGVCLGMCLVYWLTDNITLIYAPLFLTAAVIGFLPLNFPNAKIFMGDVGSNFLGLILGMFSLQAFVTAPELFWSWLVLLGVFIVDATLTLIRRLLNGEKFYIAHCSHAYQHAARKTGNHKLVSLFVFFINMIWLLPMSILIGMHYLDGFLGLMIAYLPLCLLWGFMSVNK